MSPVATREILACRETLAAGFSERLAGRVCGDPADVTDAHPAGVLVHYWAGHPHRVETLEPVGIRALHDEAVAMAWRDGAWDLRVLRVPSLLPEEMSCVTSRSYANAALRDALASAAVNGTLITWLWRPMRNGSPIRRAAHAHKDATLQLDGSRAGDPPIDLPVPRLPVRGGSETVIRLGGLRREGPIRPSGRRERLPYQARATDRQRRYIIYLRHSLGRHGEPLPARLTAAEASAIIDALKGQCGA